MKMQSGELIVTGTDQITIALQGLPAKVHAHFIHELEVIPCNPHHRDTLEWSVNYSNTVNSGFVLVIKWSVTGVREIKWTASY